MQIPGSTSAATIAVENSRTPEERPVIVPMLSSGGAELAVMGTSREPCILIIPPPPFKVSVSATGMSDEGLKGDCIGCCFPSGPAAAAAAVREGRTLRAPPDTGGFFAAARRLSPSAPTEPLRSMNAAGPPPAALLPKELAWVRWEVVGGPPANETRGGVGEEAKLMRLWRVVMRDDVAVALMLLTEMRTAGWVWLCSSWCCRLRRRRERRWRILTAGEGGRVENEEWGAGRVGGRWREESGETLAGSELRGVRAERAVMAS